MARFSARSAEPLVLFVVLLFVVLMTAGCGGGRQLQSVALSPPTADAQDFAGGKVLFVATGTFSNPPSPVNLTAKDVTWCVGGSNGSCAGNIDVGAIVDETGLAQCNPGFVGTATILAGTGASIMGNPDSGSQLKVFGSAKLTCP
jgi:hypothetical protein